MIKMLFLFINLCYGLFAGNGISTNSYTDDGKVISFGCNTYDDCNELLTVFLSDPTFLITTISPYPFNGNCDTLPNDNRPLSATYDIYNHNIYIKTYNTTTLSQASILLCELDKNINITEIDYYPL